MQKTLSEKFNETARAAHDAFPDRLSKLVVFLTGAETPLYVDPVIAEKLSERVSEVKNTLARESYYIFSRNAAGMAYAHYSMGGAHGIKMIGLRSDVSGIFTKNYTQEMRAVYVLDHEIGHHVVKSGFAGEHVGECAADAFAALRHVQRYGLQTDFFKYSTKASTVVLGTSPVHYTEAVFQAARRYAKKHDISGLSLQETAGLAHEMAQKAVHNARHPASLGLKFNAAAHAYRKQIGTSHAIVEALFAQDKTAYDLFCRETVKVARDNPTDGDVVKAAKRFLNYPPIKAFIKEQAKTDPAYQDILALSKIRVPPILSFKALNRPKVSLHPPKSLALVAK